MAIHRHARARFLEFAIANSSPIARPALARYVRARAAQVEIDRARLESLGLNLIELPLLARGDKIRHDPARLAAAVIDLALHSRRSRLIQTAPRSRPAAR